MTHRVLEWEMFSEAQDIYYVHLNIFFFKELINYSMQYAHIILKKMFIILTNYFRYYFIS